MKILRWLVSFPTAFIASLVIYIVEMFLPVLSSAHGGRGIFETAVGTAPIWIKSALPAFVFVISGVAISPSKERKACFLFFTLAFLFSAGGVDSLDYYQTGVVLFWYISLVGQIGGSFIGLLFSLRIQTFRNRRYKSREQNRPSESLPSTTG